jgi:hypothetical protein
MIVSRTVRRYLAADQGGAPASGEPSGSAAPTPSVNDPFAGLNLDDLDSETRKIVEASKAQFVTLQNNLKTEQDNKVKLEQLARNFQSKADSLEAKIKQVSSGQPPDPLAEKTAKIEALLVKRGVSPEMAKSQAPLFTDMFGEFANEIKGEIGRDLAPLGASVMHQAATSAWNQALQRDKIGALSNPEIAQKTWAAVQDSLNQGQGVTPESILALRNIYHTEHLENGGQQMSQHSYQQPPMPNFGGPPNFSGGGFAPTRPPTQDANASKYAVNADTQKAVNTVVNAWKGMGLGKKGAK